MTTKTKFTRFAIALVLALSAIGFSASAVLASPPVHYQWQATWYNTLTGVCNFDVAVSSALNVSATDYFDNTGALIRSHWVTVEQDTFTANGKTLVGLPFMPIAELLYDSTGQVTHVYVTGVTEKIILPDGSLFISAGRVDFMNHPGGTFVLSPDQGNPGNVAGFCAALAP
ncbi:MAG TPA: hypothetical protein VFM46_16250, partial [Pseudomonadales bacterium]|nr:hypothetical protein [Pseudomonadales bacterium]